MTKLLCLCPTFGRTETLLRNTIALFEAQDHPDKYLLIYDDCGNISGRGENWEVISTTERCPSLPAKYTYMLNYAKDKINWDAIVIWDDDDIYFPSHLSMLEKHLEKDSWVKPEWVTMNHDQPFGKLGVLKGNGRFWCTSCISKEICDKFDLFTHTLAPDFDFRILQKLTGYKKEIAILGKQNVTYAMKWAHCDGQHSSAYSNKADWYVGFKPKVNGSILLESGEYDDYTKLILSSYWVDGKFRVDD